MKKALKTWFVAFAIAMALSLTGTAHASGNNVIVDVSDPHPANIVVAKGQVLWIVAHEPVVLSYGWPKNADLKVTVGDRSLFSPGALADGLTAQDKTSLGMSQDEMPLGVYPPQKAGQTEITVTIIPKSPGSKRAFSQTVHVTVK